MPTRRDVFVNGGIYHIFSKSIDNKLIFKDRDFCLDFLGAIKYYKEKTQRLRYSRYKENLDNKNKTDLIKKLGVRMVKLTKISSKIYSI